MREGAAWLTPIPTLRRKLPEIVLEAAMVVFAVLAAFGVEEWREQRRLREFAAVARSAVETEIAENLEQFRAAAPALTELKELLDRVLLAADEGRSVPFELGMRLPAVSIAAWRAAQGSPGAPHFEHGWVIRVSRVYEGYEEYAVLRRLVVEDYTRILAHRRAFPEMEPAGWIELLEPLSGRLFMLEEMHRGVQSGLESLLE